MDIQADTYRAAKRSPYHHAQSYTSSNRVQARRTLSFRTFQTLYGGSDLQRYPGAAIAGSLKSDQAAVVTTIRTIPWEDPLPHHLQEAFGIDPLHLSTDPGFGEKLAKAAPHEDISSPTSRHGRTSTSKRAAFCQKLKSLAALFIRGDSTCSKVPGARLC